MDWTANILSNVVDFCAPIIGIALVIFCIVQAFKIFSGNESGSVKKLIVGVVLLLFIIGLMLLARNITGVGSVWENLVNNIVNQFGESGNEIIGGGGGGGH